jgi:RNA polymerase sigma-70 factor (ECF subfamily)
MELAETFETERPRLRRMATRMLNSSHDADDALQEAWIRASRAGMEGVDNPQGWLTTIVARICLDSLRARRPDVGEAPEGASPAAGPEDVVLAADAVGAALTVLLDSLEPSQRLAFMLHDVFALPFEQVAEILGKSVVACRQLASRARATVRAGSPANNPRSPQHAEDRAVVDAFLVAARYGVLATLVSVLDPEVACRADDGAAAMGSPSLQGVNAVAQFFNGAAKTARRAVVDGAAGLFWAKGGEVKVVFEFTVVGDRILAIDFLGTPEVLEALKLEPLTSKE